MWGKKKSNRVKKSFPVNGVRLKVKDEPNITLEKASRKKEGWMKEGIEFYWNGEYLKALPILLKVFEKYQEPDVVFKLGFIYDTVLGEREKAIYFYTLAFEWKNSAFAAHNLGVIYETVHNLVMARKFYRAGAERGFVKSMYNLAVLLRSGLGGPQDIEEAKRLYKVASKEKHPGALNNLAVMYEHGIGSNGKKNIVKALKLYVESSELGNPYALKNLASLLEIGVQGILEPDPAKAFTLLKRSSQLGYGLASKKLASFYEKGLVVQQSFRMAFQYYLLAVRQHCYSAAFKVAFFYNNGVGVTKSEADALKYYLLCIEKTGDPVSQHNAGIIFSKLGMLEDAMEMYERAIESNYFVSCNNFGRLLQRQGRLEEARKVFELGALNGQADAQNGLAILLEQEAKNDDEMMEAVYWYSESCSRGYSYAIFNLGVVFQYGQGNVPIDLQRSFYLYKLAALLGHTGAAEKENELFLILYGTSVMNHI